MVLVYEQATSLNYTLLNGSKLIPSNAHSEKLSNASNSMKTLRFRPTFHRQLRLACWPSFKIKVFDLNNRKQKTRDFQLFQLRGYS